MKTRRHPIPYRSRICGPVLFLLLLPASFAGEQAVREKAGSGQGQGIGAGDAARLRQKTEEYHAGSIAIATELNAARESARLAGPKAELDAIMDWHRKNAARIEAVRRQCAEIAAAAPAVERLVLETVPVPGDASPEMVALLVERGRLRNREIAVDAEIAASPVQADAIRARWNAEILASQAEQGPRLAAIQAQAAKMGPGAWPQPLIPLDASPELAAFLRERHSALRARLEAEKENPGSTFPSAARAAADQQKENRGWNGQNGPITNQGANQPQK